jgi:hypothetical protein
MYKIIPNLLSKEQEDLLESSVLNENTQWIFNRFAAYKSPAYGVSDDSKKAISSFRHAVYQNGKMLDREMFDMFKVIPEKLGAKNIYNMICQLQLVTVGKQNTIKHVDMPMHQTPYYSAVYYINNSDGPTVLYNQDGSELVRCEHERGKVIMFDGNTPHHASKPTTDIRCIMNFCFT